MAGSGRTPDLPQPADSAPWLPAPPSFRQTESGFPINSHFRECLSFRALGNPVLTHGPGIGPGHRKRERYLTANRSEVSGAADPLLCLETYTKLPFHGGAATQ